MFVKIYRYKIKRKDFERWKRITGEANRAYQKYDRNFRWKRFVRKGKKFVNVVEIGYWKSKKYFVKAFSKINKDKKIKKLWKEFLEVVNPRTIKEEEFESI